MQTIQKWDTIEAVKLARIFGGYYNKTFTNCEGFVSRHQKKENFKLRCKKAQFIPLFLQQDKDCVPIIAKLG